MPDEGWDPGAISGLRAALPVLHDAGDSGRERAAGAHRVRRKTRESTTGAKRLHNAKAKPLPSWEERRKLLFEYEADLVRSDEMARSLATLGLLETFTMQAVPRTASHWR